MKLPGGRLVGGHDDGSREDVQGHDQVKVVAKSLWRSASHDSCQVRAYRGCDTTGDIDQHLSVGAESAREDFRRDRLGKSLIDTGNACNSLAGNGLADGIGAGNDDGSDGAEGQRSDHHPFPAPKVRRATDRGPKDDGLEGQDESHPCRLAGAAQNRPDRVGQDVGTDQVDVGGKIGTLELGCKSPLVIFDDADLARAVPAATLSILSNSS